MKALRNVNIWAFAGLFFIIFGWAIIAGLVWLACLIF